MSPPSQSEILIALKGVTKVFRLSRETVYALSGVDLDIFRGEYLSIMGPSGSGKSTLFNMIGALDRPSEGSVEVAGLSLNQLNPRQLAYFRGNHIGYIFQSYNLLFAYSATENVAMPLVFCGVDHHEARSRATEMLERVGLGHRLDHRPDELSGGQQQRVAIARALVNQPAILLADEPTANLDLKTGEEIIELMQGLCREDGVTVISATHDHKMLSVSDRIVWIRDGQVEKIETPDQAGVRVGTIESAVGKGT
ncbi:MAG: ABC transporter ATP-binding protein [Opitutales bacterium]